MMFLLVSCQLPLFAFIFLEAKLKVFLSSAELQRRDHHIRQCALLDANQSPWQKLYHSRNEQSIITFTGLDYAAKYWFQVAPNRPPFQDFTNTPITHRENRVGGSAGEAPMVVPTQSQQHPVQSLTQSQLLSVILEWVGCLSDLIMKHMKALKKEELQKLGNCEFYKSYNSWDKMMQDQRNKAVSYFRSLSEDLQGMSFLSVC